MEGIAFGQLEEKIQKAVELIGELRSANATLKEELKAARAGLRDQETRSKKTASESEEIKKMKEAVRRMTAERNMIRQKVRNALRKLESIQLAERKSQQDLFE